MYSSIFFFSFFIPSTWINSLILNVEHDQIISNNFPLTISSIGENFLTFHPIFVCVFSLIHQNIHISTTLIYEQVTSI